MSSEVENFGRIKIRHHSVEIGNIGLCKPQMLGTRQTEIKLEFPGMTNNKSRNMYRMTDIDWRAMTAEQIDAVLATIIGRYEQHICQLGHRPKRESYVVERIAAIENLRVASVHSSKGKLNKRYVKLHIKNREKELRQIQLLILTQSLPTVEYRTDKIRSDAKKERDIIKKNYQPWHILDHAIMQIVGPMIVRTMIYDSIACIKGKGLHFGVERIKRAFRDHPEMQWYWKCDSKKFYQSIPHTLIRQRFERIIKDPNFNNLLDHAILFYQSPEQIIRQIENERERIRYIYRRLPKSVYRELFDSGHRPRDEDDVQSLHSLLR